MKKVIDFILENWHWIGPVIYEILIRVFPTEKNLSIIDNSWKVLNWVITNKRKPDGTEIYAERQNGTIKNCVNVPINKHILMCIIICISISSFSQSPITTQSRGLFLYNGSDTTSLKNTRASLQSATGNTGGLFFDKINNKWRVWTGTTWVNWNLFNSSGAPTITASNGLTKTLNNITLGGTLSSNTSILGGGNNLSLGTSGSKLFQFSMDASNTVQLNTSGNAFNILNSNASGTVNITAGGATSTLNVTGNSVNINGGTGGTDILNDNVTNIGTNTGIGFSVDGTAQQVSAGATNASLLLDNNNQEFLLNSQGDGTINTTGNLFVSGSGAIFQSRATYSADFSAGAGNRDIMDKAYVDTKLDGTMVASRVPIGVDVNTLTTNSGFTFTDGITDYLRVGSIDIGQPNWGGFTTLGLISNTPTLGVNIGGADGTAGTVTPAGVTISGGFGYTVGNNAGGQVTILSGPGNGTGRNGNIGITLNTNGHTPAGYLIISGLPTSSAGLPSGAIWSNAGVLTIVP